MKKLNEKIKNRINYLKRKIKNGNISYGELAELQSYEDFLIDVLGWDEEQAKLYTEGYEDFLIDEAGFSEEQAKRYLGKL